MKKAGLKLNIQKTKIMASSPITSWQIDGEMMETGTDFIFLGSKITAVGDCSHEIKRCLLLGRKVITNLNSILKSRYRTDSLEMTLFLGRTEDRRRRGRQRMRWFECHHSLNGHESEQTPRGWDGQGSLECCRPWGCKESDKNWSEQYWLGTNLLYTLHQGRSRDFL